MSTTANSSNLFDNYKQRLSSAANTGRVMHRSGSHVSYQAGENYQDVLNDLQKTRRHKKIELESAEGMRGRNTAMSGARSAFAAGAASRSKKLFRPKGPTAFSAIGKTDAATEAAILNRRKEISDLENLDPESPANVAKNRITSVQSLGFFAF